jgi:hypothetical protein
MQQFNKVIVTKKNKQQYLKVTFNKDEVSTDGQIFDARWVKESNQKMSKALSQALTSLTPHLLFATKLADSSIKLDQKLDYPKWFREDHWKDDERFEDVTITGVQFFGNETLESVKLFGYKEVDWTESGKSFKNKIETPVLHLSRSENNLYPLTVQLDEQIGDLTAAVELWLEKGDTLSKKQQELELN